MAATAALAAPPSAAAMAPSPAAPPPVAEIKQDAAPADKLVDHAMDFDGNWRGLVDELKLGLARALAQHCELVSFGQDQFHLSVPNAQKHLLESSYQEKLRTAIEQYFGRKIQLKFEIGGTGNTPAEQISQEKAALQSKAESAIREDDFVQALVKDFGAQIIPSSIKPIQ